MPASPMAAKVVSCSRPTLPLDRGEHDRVFRGGLDPAAALALNARVIAVAVQHDDERHGLRRGANGFARDVLVAQRQTETRQIFGHGFIPDAELVVHHVRLELPGFGVVVRVEALAVGLGLGHVEPIVLAEDGFPRVLERLREIFLRIRQLAHDDALQSRVRVRIRVGGERLRVVDFAVAPLAAMYNWATARIRPMNIGGNRNRGRDALVHGAAVGEDARDSEGVFGDDAVDERRPGADADDLQVRRTSRAQQVLKCREIGRSVRGAIARTDDEGARLVFVEVRRHAEIGDQLFRLVRGPLLVDVDEIGRRVGWATIAECRRGRTIVGIDHRLLRRDARGAEERRSREQSRGKTGNVSYDS